MAEDTTFQDLEELSNTSVRRRIMGHQAILSSYKDKELWMLGIYD